MKVFFNPYASVENNANNLVTESSYASLKMKHKQGNGDKQ